MRPQFTIHSSISKLGIFLHPTFCHLYSWLTSISVSLCWEIACWRRIWGQKDLDSFTQVRWLFSKFMSICKTHFIWSNKNYGEVFSNCWPHCSLLKDAVKLDFVTTGTLRSCSFIYGVFLFAVKPILQPSCTLLNWLTHLKIFLLLSMLSLQNYDIQPICDTKKVRKSDKSQILLENWNL